MNASCVEWGTDPCPSSALLHHGCGPSATESEQAEANHPDAKIASFGVSMLAHFDQTGIGTGGSNRPFFLCVPAPAITRRRGVSFMLMVATLYSAIGIHKPHLPHTVPEKYFAMYPDLNAIPLPANRRVPVGLPKEAWYASGEMREYTCLHSEGGECSAHFPANFSEDRPVDADRVRLIRRGYFAATSFADAQLGRVMDALSAAGPRIADNTITVLWSDHGWHLVSRQRVLYLAALVVPLIRTQCAGRD